MFSFILFYLWWSCVQNNIVSSVLFRCSNQVFRCSDDVQMLKYSGQFMFDIYIIIY